MFFYVNNKLSLTFFIIFVIVLISACGYKTEIENYKSCSKICFSRDDGETMFAIREYKDRRIPHMLAVEPDTLRTSVIKASGLRCNDVSFPEIYKKYGSANYVKMLIFAKKNSDPLQNAGITRFTNKKNEVYLTADLCPSKLPLDRKLFTVITEISKKTGKAVPVGLAISGLWMEKHAEEINWLKTLEQKSLLEITWINHTYNHYYYNKLPLKNNFLLKEGTDIKNEVLNTERKMLELGLTPSVFFRFPGLVSNRDLFYKIIDYGLIPIGSDAWLAKNQKPKNGSVILVHANGNEPAGIRILFKLLRSKTKNIINSTWLLKDLKDSASEL